MSDPNDPLKARRKMVLGLTGMPGSGKGEITSVAQDMGVPSYSLGDVVREFHAMAPYMDRPEDIGIFANGERESHGDDVWARRLVERIDRGLSELAIIDGVRSLFEVDVFRSEWGDDFKIISVHSSPGTRFSRLLTRGREDDPLDRSDFDARDLRELGWGIGDVIALSDIMVLNEGTAADLREKARDILTIIGWG
ncbi:MAG: AAA family ATPase [Candidatus Thermoplasmatota archaeon]|nr:AAA family ATPase [Candidatus Thermoplasmatota archaeon]